MRNRDIPAHPTADNFINVDTGQTMDVGGLTKREYAAIAAMQGLLEGSTWEEISMDAQNHGMLPQELVAKSAVLHADALFDELEESK